MSVQLSFCVLSALREDFDALLTESEATIPTRMVLTGDLQSDLSILYALQLLVLHKWTREH